MEKTEEKNEQQQRQKQEKEMYLRFGAMILTSMVVMYWLMFISSWELDHVRFSQSRVFMSLTMGGTMGLIMLAWMRHTYRNTKANMAIVFVSILLFSAGIFLDRNQITVEDIRFMQGMIPHHSLAITRAERAQIDDVRVCDLAYEISEAQRREIADMDWLLEDIQRNGLAKTREEADSRPIPEFRVEAVRECP